MPRTVAEKMGIKPGARAIFVDAPDTAVAAIELPEIDKVSEVEGDFDYIHLFSTSQQDLDEKFPKLKVHLKQKGMFWVSWPKNRQLNSDLTIKSVIRIGYTHGLVESTALSVDSTWSAIKFTHPLKGKEYNNSYGKLP